MSTVVALPAARRAPAAVSLVPAGAAALAHADRLADRGRAGAVAVLGPYLAPYGPQDFAGSPYQPAGGKLLFGADSLGQDVWSRFLDGGRSILLVSALATILGVGIGVLVGLSAALARRAVDDLLMRAVDLLLAFPSILLALVAVATVGPNDWLIVARGRGHDDAEDGPRDPRRGRLGRRARLRDAPRARSAMATSACSSSRSCRT